MTYPPGGPGYPSYPPVQPEPSKLPVYLTTSVVVLGLAAYLASFGPILTVTAEVGPFGGTELSGSGGGYPVIPAVIAALLAAVSILPKAKNYSPVVAVAAVLSVLLVIAQVTSKPPGFAIGWALWLVLAFTLLQAIAASATVLLEAGVISPPAPRVRYQYPDQYAQYPQQFAGYYGQPGQGLGAPAQRPDYPPQYGGGYPAGPSTGGFGSPSVQDGPPTPPTGFPSFSPPPSTGHRPEAGSVQPAHSQESPSEPQSGSKPS